MELVFNWIIYYWVFTVDVNIEKENDLFNYTDHKTCQINMSIVDINATTKYTHRIFI